MLVLLKQRQLFFSATDEMDSLSDDQIKRLLGPREKNEATMTTDGDHDEDEMVMEFFDPTILLCL